MGTIFMSWNSIAAIFMMALLGGCSATRIQTGNICPPRTDSALQYAEVFDGPCDDLVILLPNEASETDGFWNLGYVYDEGRTVHIRCSYFDQSTADINLQQRIEQCVFHIRSDGVLALNCQ